MLTQRHETVRLAPALGAEVRRVDKDAGKITLRHGPLPQLDMPTGMTMIYRMKDPAMLDRVAVGDTVIFTADRIDGQFTVTGIEKKR